MTLHCMSETAEQVSQEPPDNRLHEAARNGDLRAAQAALADGADPNARAGSLRVTPIMIAAVYGLPHIVRFLLLNGADTQLADTRGIEVSEYLESPGILRLEVRERFEAAMAQAIVNAAMHSVRNAHDTEKDD